MDWITAPLPCTSLTVGPCLWRAGALRDHEAARWAHEHPSAVVAMAEEEPDALARVASELGELPLVLIVPEPRFARRLLPMCHERLEAAGRRRADVLALAVDDLADLKGGRCLQTLFEARESGLCRDVGLMHPDPLAAEWIATNTAPRLLITRFDPQDQTAGYRVIDAAAEHGMAVLAIPPTEPPSGEALAATHGFGLSLPLLGPRGDAATPARHVRAILDPPLASASPWSASQRQAAWHAFAEAHPEPPHLPRSVPPDAAG